MGSKNVLTVPKFKIIFTVAFWLTVKVNITRTRHKAVTSGETLHLFAPILGIALTFS